MQWTNDIITSCTGPLAQTLAEPLASLRNALPELVDAYKAPLHPLVPRPALFVFSHIASSVYLLEHAIWAAKTSEPGHDIDAEVFTRWVLEGGLDAALGNVRRAKNSSQDRMQTDSAIVYGANAGKVGARL